MISTRQATRVDPQTGIREIAELFGPSGAKVFGFTHLPASDARAGVVICSPLYAEFVRNYRREVLIGRRLASIGVAVQRFHYRGHGNGDGNIADSTFESMLDDARAAAKRLIETAAVESLAFFGTRFGALLAAAASHWFDNAPLALWDPVLDPTQYLHTILRARRIQALKDGERLGSSVDMERYLQRDGAIHVLGYSVTRSLYESSVRRDLGTQVGTTPRPMLIVELGQDPLHRRLAELVTAWRDVGFDVARCSIGKQEAWWFTSGALVVKEDLTEPVDVTVDWLASILAAREREP